MTKNQTIAHKHAMDIPHVAAVELPLIVNNTAKAIEMIGGQDKIAQAVNSLHTRRALTVVSQSTKNNMKNLKERLKSPSINSSSSSNSNKGLNSGDKKLNPLNINNNISEENTGASTLELRLRPKDPYHHPIQSILSTSEKVLLKVSIPKDSLPKDYYDNPDNYKVRDLLAQSKSGKYRVRPVAIIDKTYSFKLIADFQVSTKNNKYVQEFTTEFMGAKTYENVVKFVTLHLSFQGIEDFKDPDSYANIDHHLPPPPVFSNIKYPFDFRYQKNPLTTTIKTESGEVKVVAKKDTLKLHTIIIDYYADPPLSPRLPLIQNLASLTSSDLEESSPDKLLLECIRWLEGVFAVKPIWLRRHLKDIAPPHLLSALKQALPYVTYIYKSGPWRFCNIKYGVDPRSNQKYWRYQSEYFRTPGVNFNNNPSIAYTSENRRLPLSIDVDKVPEGRMADFSIHENLLFDGKSKAVTITYQVGDFLDPDILATFSSKMKEDQFFRDEPDSQDGWIVHQCAEIMRRLVRYKLNRIMKELPIESLKITKILQTEYDDIKEPSSQMEIDDELKEAVAGDGLGREDNEEVEDEDDEGENLLDEDDEGDEGADAIAPGKSDAVLAAKNERALDMNEGIMNRLSQLDDYATQKLQGLVGYIKQNVELEDGKT
ncbi:tau 95 subunit of transcription factor TFIIIC [Scheffersomyces spartinae]|uniref:Tau 95 subunit of transcription factor TFIIIC n=1 Tax=Scheffersomyces spartinae TaxID=45513 RepID=A0A9P7V6Q8_9ASCO|nr:tau 95 subunit of transcription factor TFIIIC [Scheffersomyces spartinae]KAG7192247.1 tau 95 subunit of transcription factor TFIIIC [Scheffersomyces spartinae]